MNVKNKPSDSPFCQQRLQSYFTSNVFTTATLFILIGILFVPGGKVLLDDAGTIYEQTQTYSGNNNKNNTSSGCYITTDSTNDSIPARCQVSFTFDVQVTGPIYLYYKLSNFYQNHRRYFPSKSIPQLQGQVLSEAALSLNCNPLLKSGDNLLNPCGLIANSFFNDQFSLNENLTWPRGLQLNETDISLMSDRNALYLQVDGFQSLAADASVSCASVGLNTGCKNYLDPVTGINFKYFYPNDESTQYLHETYPGQISPLDGVTDEHFIVWMRTASLPTFRKLYGRIDGNFNPGDVLAFDIISNFEVQSFDGTKSLLLSTVGNLGGQNRATGTAFIVVGVLCMAVGLLIATEEFFKDLRIKKELMLMST